MAKFKKGDKVVRKVEWQTDNWLRDAANPSRPQIVRHYGEYVIQLDGVPCAWDADKFELYVEPQPEPVTVTEPPMQQIPGVPDGYRLVRIGAPKKGEQFIGGYNILSKADINMYDYAWAIVEPIAPPAPPTPIPTKVTVQLNRYLVGDLSAPSTLRVVESTAEYVGDNYNTYRLLGPSETLELEVEV